jgi:hypothetical protein
MAELEPGYRTRLIALFAALSLVVLSVYLVWIAARASRQSILMVVVPVASMVVINVLFACFSRVLGGPPRGGNGPRGVEHNLADGRPTNGGRSEEER